jgi:hypothetical protein
MDIISYDSIRDYLKTGDIVLFSGTGLAGGAIKLLTRSPWSHVGLIVRRAGEAEPLLWESMPSGFCKDVDSGSFRTGVQLVRLSERLARFTGPVAVRRLNRPLCEQQRWRLEALQTEVADRRYERNLLELAFAAFDWLTLNREDLTTLFCSELVAETYQRIRLLDDVEHGALPSNEYTPGHFDERSDLGLNQGFALGPNLHLCRGCRATSWAPLAPRAA